jgi:hypothetical protein
LKKGNSSIADYFQQFTGLTDSLTTINQPIIAFEVVSFLVGIGSDYDSFVTSVTTRVEPLAIEEIYGHLLAHEQRLLLILSPKAEHSVMVDPLASTVGVAHLRPSPTVPTLTHPITKGWDMDMALMLLLQGSYARYVTNLVTVPSTATTGSTTIIIGTPPPTCKPS